MTTGLRSSWDKKEFGQTPPTYERNQSVGLDSIVWPGGEDHIVAPEAKPRAHSTLNTQQVNIPPSPLFLHPFPTNQPTKDFIDKVKSTNETTTSLQTNKHAQNPEIKAQILLNVEHKQKFLWPIQFLLRWIKNHNIERFKNQDQHNRVVVD